VSSEVGKDVETYDNEITLPKCREGYDPLPIRVRWEKILLALQCLDVVGAPTEVCTEEKSPVNLSRGRVSAEPPPVPTYKPRRLATDRVPVENFSRIACRHKHFAIDSGGAHDMDVPHTVSERIWIEDVTSIPRHYRDPCRIVPVFAENELGSDFRYSLITATVKVPRQFGYGVPVLERLDQLVALQAQRGVIQMLLERRESRQELL
jgi:hypothetical protein